MIKIIIISSSIQKYEFAKANTGNSPGKVHHGQTLIDGRYNRANNLWSSTYRGQLALKMNEIGAATSVNAAEPAAATSRAAPHHSHEDKRKVRFVARPQQQQQSNNNVMCLVPAAGVTRLAASAS